VTFTVSVLDTCQVDHTSTRLVHFSWLLVAMKLSNMDVSSVGQIFCKVGGGKSRDPTQITQEEQNCKKKRTFAGCSDSHEHIIKRDHVFHSQKPIPGKSWHRSSVHLPMSTGA